MKVIDLLNKIANGEEVPRKIKYDDNIFDLFISSFNKVYYNNKNQDEFFVSYDVSRILNDEVEVIEDKKIEKLENKIDTTFENYNYSERMRLTEMVNKINEIIDKINSMEAK